MTTAFADTKAHWRRRALRAEAQLEDLRQRVYRNAVMRVAIEEIETTLADMRQALKEGP